MENKEERTATLDELQAKLDADRYKLKAESLAVELEIRLAAYDASMSLLGLLLEVSENDTALNSPLVADIRLRFHALRGAMS